MQNWSETGEYLDVNRDKGPGTKLTDIKRIRKVFYAR